MNNSILLIFYLFFCHVKSGQVNFCPGKLILKLLARIGEWHQNLSEKTVYIYQPNYHSVDTSLLNGNSADRYFGQIL